MTSCSVPGCLEDDTVVRQKQQKKIFLITQEVQMQGKDGFRENNSNFKVLEGQASTAIFLSTLRVI